VLLGGTIAPDELARLVADRRPFVSIGRRDDAGGPVPYVGVDYPSATAALVRRAVAAGHRTLAYAGEGEGSESYADRKQGFAAGVAEANVDGLHLTVAGRNPDGVLDELRRAGATAVFVEDYADGVALAERAAGRGLAVPGHLSIVMLGDPIRPVACDIDFTGLRIPRLEMGRQAVEIVDGLVQGLDVPIQRLLAAEIVDGVTLGPVHVPTAGAPRTNRRRVSVD
jgi:DNA-binding LacI/PurR family transcriptional regulator